MDLFDRTTLFALTSLPKQSRRALTKTEFADLVRTQTTADPDEWAQYVWQAYYDVPAEAAVDAYNVAAAHVGRAVHLRRLAYQQHQERQRTTRGRGPPVAEYQRRQGGDDDDETLGLD